MLEGFDFAVIGRSLGYVLGTGLALTLKLTLIGTAGGIALGGALAAMRLSRLRALAAFAASYIGIMRSLPLTLTIFWLYFAAPYVASWILRAGAPVDIGAFASAACAFVAFEAAYYAEILRAGTLAVPSGQMRAGLALGMRRSQAMRHIVLPQALRHALPVLLTQTVALFQDVSLVYILSLPDFLGAASQIARRDGKLAEMYVFVAVVYFAICFALSRVIKHWQKRSPTYS